MDFSSGMNALFEPRRVAIIGASSQEDKLGYTLAKNVLEFGFGGELFLVNHKGGWAFDRELFTTISAVGTIDLALISVPALNIPKVIAECGAAGVRAAVILSSGFTETGDSGKRLQQEVAALAKHYCLRILGPNCMGILNLNYNFNGTYFWALPNTCGKISFVSQSGAMGGLFFQKIRERNLGVAKFVSVGNMVDMTHGEVVSYLADDEDTNVIGLFVEGIPEGRTFLQQVARASKVKPVVMLKVGRTAAGRRAAQSHTGSLVGETEVLKTAVQESGVLWAENSEQFFDMLTALGTNSYPMRQNSLGVITISGGPGVLAADLAEEQGIRVPILTPDTINRLKPLLTDFAARTNPVDMTPQTSDENYQAVMLALAEDTNVGGLLAINVGLDREDFAHGLAFARQSSNKPVLAFTVDTPKVNKILQAYEIQNFPTLEGALRGFHALRNANISTSESEQAAKINIKFEPEIGEAELWQRICGRTSVNEFEVKRLLKAWGLPIVREQLVRSWAETETKSEEIGFPLVIKICRDDIIHKTEVGGVIPNIRDKASLLKAWQDLESKFPGDTFLLQEMIQAEVEIILGARRDPLFGSVVMVGLGGTAVEVFKDIALGLAPLTEKRAWRMLRGLKSYELLHGFRGRGSMAESAIVDALIRLGDLMEKHPNIDEIDINPLMVTKEEACIVDANMILQVN